jgi:glycerol-3-phosphate O-acyltransferase
VEGGVVQAVFPEGGLSRDGRLRKPKIGLLDYMLRGFDPEGGRDLIFIPVALNYDRVLEDRTLLLMDRPKAGAEHPKRGGRAALTTLRFVLHNFWLMLRGRWHRFGYACANFGTPISMRSYLAEREWDFRDLEKEERGRRVGELAGDLMAQIGRLMPALPVSIVASVMLMAGDQAVTREWIQERARRLMEDLEQRGARIYVPRDDRGYAVTVGLRMLTLRHLVVPDGEGFHAAPDERDLLAYYANALTTLAE